MQEEMTEHIESADDANLQTSRARKGQNNEFKQQIKIKISAIEDKLNAYPLASKTCLPRSSKLWNTVILIMSSLLVSPKLNRMKVPQNHQSFVSRFPMLLQLMFNRVTLTLRIESSLTTLLADNQSLLFASLRDTLLVSAFKKGGE